MDFHVTLGGRGGLTTRIYRGLFDGVLDGRLRPGEQLPPTRELARQLNVSRNTVALAYERLVAEGVLTGRVGAGTFVSTDPVAHLRARHAPAGRGVHPRSLWKALQEPAPVQSITPLYDFRVGGLHAGMFPFTTWRRLMARELRSAAVAWGQYGEPSGYAGLRAAIARHVGVSRAVVASADDVIITQGAQQALDLVGRVLIDPGDMVAVEEPGYSQARRLFRSLGARVAGVPVDDEGLEVSRIPTAARLVYVTPSHQFPLGMAMSLSRRAALLAWAEKQNAVVIEDDYDSEFRFAGRPLDPLQSLDRCGRVVYVGSFSKVMLPTLRLGFLIAPASLQPALRTAKALTDWHGESATQAALARFIDDGLLARHIRKVAREYAKRHARICEVIERDFAEWLCAIPSAAGLHVAAHLTPGATMNMNHVAKRADARGVRVRPISYFCMDTPSRDGLVIGYGAITTPKVDEGLRRLAQSFRVR
jgi:GntR family transcriptional regulator/MocR family aminotransferase